MGALRGFVGVFGLAALLFGFVASQGDALAQLDPEFRVLEERGRENRERIVSVEANVASVATRLTRIETELEIARRATEQNGQLMTGLVVGIGLMLTERLFVLFGWLRGKGGSVDD